MIPKKKKNETAERRVRQGRIPAAVAGFSRPRGGVLLSAFDSCASMLSAGVYSVVVRRPFSLCFLFFFLVLFSLLRRKTKAISLHK
jgi:hypothetical protein